MRRPNEGRAAILAAFKKRLSSRPNARWCDAESLFEGTHACSSRRVIAKDSSGAPRGIDGCGAWTFAGGKVTVKDAFYMGE